MNIKANPKVRENDDRHKILFHLNPGTRHAHNKCDNNGYMIKSCVLSLILLRNAAEYFIPGAAKHRNAHSEKPETFTESNTNCAPVIPRVKILISDL
jgi:hypothetical protein